MSEAIARRALVGRIVEVKAGNIVEVKSAVERVRCDECGSEEVCRIYRRGFFQEKIYPLFGFYPWRCKRCGQRLMLRKRALASRQDSME
jgi:DNA-directed RNA polymerase subunit RPC12/RpoP